MPNYVTTKLTFRGSKEFVEQLVNAVKTKESAFDFNKIIPMPQSLNITSGSYTERGMQYLLLKSKSSSIFWTNDERSFVEKMESSKNSEDEKERDYFDECLKLGRIALENIAKYGAPTWYEWCIAHWGTKWNACDVDDNDLPYSITFQTAWSFPYPVIQKLSEMFPEVKIGFIFADEDCGSNTGRGTFVAGEEQNVEYPETGSKRAYELYIAAWGEQDWLVYDKETDNYRYVEDE